MMASQAHTTEPTRWGFCHLVDWHTLPDYHRGEALHWEAVLWDVQDGMCLTPDEGAALARWLFGKGL